MKFATFRGLAIAGGLLVGAGALFGACALCARTDGGSGQTPPKPTTAVTQPATGSPTPQPAPKPTSPSTSPAAKGNLRPMDQAILDRLPQNITGDKVKDAFPGQTYKVSFYKDAGESAVNRVKIDLDRDEKWDEKWTIETKDGRQKIKRQVAPADDESYTDEYRLENGSWVKK